MKMTDYVKDEDIMYIPLLDDIDMETLTDLKFTQGQATGFKA